MQFSLMCLIILQNVKAVAPKLNEMCRQSIQLDRRTNRQGKLIWPKLVITGDKSQPENESRYVVT